MTQPPRPQPRSSTTVPGWWVVVAALACVLAGLVVYAVLTSGDSAEPAPPAPPSASPSASPSPTCCGPDPDPSPSPSSPEPDPPADDHHPRGLAGHWLHPGYAGGATEFTFPGTNARPVGASADDGVYAFLLDDALHGISTTTGEAVWEYPSFMCSAGSRDGVALCSTIAVPQDHFPDGIPAPLVGIDLATGTVAYEVATEVLPTHIRLVDVAGDLAIHIVNDRAVTASSYGRIQVLALTGSGEVAWRSDTGIDDILVQAAVVEGDRLALVAGDRLQLIDLGDGSTVFEFEGADTSTSVQWDGFGHYRDGVGTEFRDWEGNLLLPAEEGYAVQPFPYFELSVTPVYPLAMLGLGQADWPRTIMFSPEGAKLLGEVGMTFGNTGTPIPSSGPLSIAADRSVVAVTDHMSRPTLHRIDDGSVIASFGTDGHQEPWVVDGYLSIEEWGINDDGAFRILLPAR